MERKQLDRAERAVLDLAAEESLLVEVPEEVEPNTKGPRSAARAQQVVGELLRAGLVGILDLRTNTDLTDADLAALREDEAAWLPGPKGNYHLAVFLTDAGWDAYERSN